MKAVISVALGAMLLGAAPQWSASSGTTPESIEALSWQARRDVASGDLRNADAEATSVLRQSEGLLKGQPLDGSPHLALAVGAAYEVQAQVLEADGQKTAAIQLLQNAMRQWAGTSIATRLQKNLNLLTLAGKHVPPLNLAHWIGSRKPQPLSSFRGKVVLLFFWADWCVDCKVQAPALINLATEFRSRGLVVIAPTMLYGYTPAEEHATAAEETIFAERVFQRFYSAIPDVEVPLDSENFQRFGASTVPTVVLVDRRGIIRLYHPGVIDEGIIKSALLPLLNS
jgi:thiol-disulfide isomerase/thioredoxin